MAKKIEKKLKIQAMAGQASPAPPLGPTLGQAGLNIGEFTQRFNADTQDRMGELVPAVITVYEDKSFDIKYKTAPASDMIKKAAGVKKGSGTNTTTKVGSITKAQAREIAESKMPDLNANDLDAATKIIEGSCRSMGIEVK